MNFFLLLSVVSVLYFEDCFSSYLTGSFKLLKINGSDFSIDTASESYNNVDLCSNFCILENCTLFRFKEDELLCQLGHLTTTDLLKAPLSGQSGHKVYIRGNVPTYRHIAAIGGDGSTDIDINFDLMTETNLLPNWRNGETNRKLGAGVKLEEGMLTCSQAFDPMQCHLVKGTGIVENYNNLLAGEKRIDAIVVTVRQESIWLLGGRQSRTNGLPAFNSTMLYDRVNGWRIGPEMPYPTFYTHAIMISTHETLLAGGDGSTAAGFFSYIYDFKTNEWTPTMNLTRRTRMGTMGKVDLDDGTRLAILIGGKAYDAMKYSDVRDKIPVNASQFDCATRIWSVQTIPALPAHLFRTHGSLVHNNPTGRIFFFLTTSSQTNSALVEYHKNHTISVLMDNLTFFRRGYATMYNF